MRPVESNWYKDASPPLSLSVQKAFGDCTTKPEDSRKALGKAHTKRGEIVWQAAMKGSKRSILERLIFIKMVLNDIKIKRYSVSFVKLVASFSH